MKHNIYQINYNQHEGGIFLTEISTTNIAENLYYVDDIERIRENSFACNTFTQLSQYTPVRIYHYIPFPIFIFSCLRLNYNSLFQNESFCMFLDRFFFLYNWTVTLVLQTNCSVYCVSLQSFYSSWPASIIIIPSTAYLEPDQSYKKLNARIQDFFRGQCLLLQPHPLFYSKNNL